MNCYEELIDECYKENVIVIEKAFKSRAKGLWKNNKIGISSKLCTIKEKHCILAEEYGHYKTTSGNITNLSDIRNLKQENKARAFAIEKLCSLDNIINTIKKGATNRYEIAEMLNITEEFFDDAISYYTCKIKLYIKDNIILYFDNTLIFNKMSDI